MPIEMDLSNTRDQALLTLVVDEAGRQLESSVGYLGRTAMQKIVYFLQVCGAPMRYRFQVHHYGPFCTHVLSDVDWLCFTGALEDRSADSTRYSDYRLGENGLALIDQFKGQLDPVRDTVRRVVSALLPLRPDQLELISTMHYVYRELQVALRRSPEPPEVIEQFKKYKGDKFSDELLSSTYDRLEKAGFFSPITV